MQLLFLVKAHVAGKLLINHLSSAEQSNCV